MSEISTKNGCVIPQLEAYDPQQSVEDLSIIAICNYFFLFILDFGNYLYLLIEQRRLKKV